MSFGTQEEDEPENRDASPDYLLPNRSITPHEFEHNGNHGSASDEKRDFDDRSPGKCFGRQDVVSPHQRGHWTANRVPKLPDTIDRPRAKGEDCYE